MQKKPFFTLALLGALVAGGMTAANAQSYDNAVKLAGISGLVSHDGVPTAFDAVNASDEQLEAYGFPPRPDQNDTKAYERWVLAVSMTRVPGKYVNTGRYHLPNHLKGKVETNSTENISNYSSGNWNGFAIYGGSPALTKVEGEWIVPSVNNQYSIPGDGYMSEWVGLDGDGTNDLIQDGTEQQYAGGASYYAWIEFYPQPELEVSSFPVAPGDVIIAYSWVTGSGSSVKGNYYLANLNTKKSGSTSLKIPSGTKFVGKSAEWIVERTEVNGSFQNPLPFYADSWMGYSYAFRNSSTAIPFKNQANQNITMENSSSAALSTVTALDSDSMWFSWKKYE